ncbi:kinase-like domain-containing protein [Xylariomycetidae sp. FL2044]|nr:kinase-like domain-containing protein [Xylariomycetidae sp. FL2044]
MASDDLPPGLHDYFSDARRFTLIKDLRGGATGLVRLYRETSPEGEARRFVLKWPNEDDEAIIGNIQNEKRWLQVLSNAEHIVRILALGPVENLPQEVFLIIEYLENGLLYQFLRRFGSNPIPNRMLWSIFLCLIRASVAMAWPPGPGEPEDVRVDTPSALTHWDMHDMNLMFGRHDAASSEHRLVPILKLIDFDLAGERDEAEDFEAEERVEYDDGLNLRQYIGAGGALGASNIGTAANVRDIGLVMTRIINGDRTLEVEDARDYIQEDHQDLDGELRLLIARCLAVDPDNRPTLQELLAVAYNAVLTRTYAGTASAGYESDANIARIVQTYILNADHLDY